MLSMHLEPIGGASLFLAFDYDRSCGSAPNTPYVRYPIRMFLMLLYVIMVCRAASNLCLKFVCYFYSLLPDSSGAHVRPAPV